MIVLSREARVGYDGRLYEKESGFDIEGDQHFKGICSKGYGGGYNGNGVVKGGDEVTVMMMMMI